ncbi:MAG: exopolysaccharide biosynthesis polyprenyl glycosylphosphotransferase [Pseudomonadota bacterium]
MGFVEPDISTLNEAARTVARRLQRGALEPFWLVCVAVCVELPVFAVAFWFLQYAAVPVGQFNPLQAAVWGLISSGVYVCSMVLSDGYASKVMADRTLYLMRSLLCLAVPVLVLAVLLPGPTTIVIFAAFLSLATVLVPTRLAFPVAVRWFVETGLIARRAVIAGGGSEAARLIRGLAERPANDIQVFGIFDDREDDRSPIQVLGVPKIGGYDDLLTFVRATEVSLVIIALPLAAEARIKWLLDAFRILPVEVGISTFSTDFAFGTVNRAPILAKISRSFTPDCRLIKRLFDIFFALIALSLVWPLMLVAALSIRAESRGPILFRQQRHGYNDRVIEVLKFRSMYHEVADPEAKQVVTKGDARVTRVGRIIRRTSIDELPQLFNVLRGDLSLVGPRPHALQAQSSQNQRFAEIVNGYSARHRLPPGITGWAQINGCRGEIDVPEKLQARLEHDLFYIENWSLWLDLKILFRTPRSLLNSAGAY